MNLEDYLIGIGVSVGLGAIIIGGLIFISWVLEAPL